MLVNAGTAARYVGTTILLPAAKFTGEHIAWPALKAGGTLLYNTLGYALKTLATDIPLMLAAGFAADVYRESWWNDKSFLEVAQSRFSTQKYCELYKLNTERCRPYINLLEGEQSTTSGPSFFKAEKEAVKEDFSRLYRDAKEFARANPDIVATAGIGAGAALGYFAVAEALREPEEGKEKNYTKAGVLGAASGATFYGTYLATSSNTVNPMPEASTTAATEEATKGFFETTQESMEQILAQAKDLVENYGLDALSYSSIVVGGALAYLAAKEALDQPEEATQETTLPGSTTSSTEEKVEEESASWNKKAWTMGVAAATAIAAGATGLFYSYNS